MERSKIHKSLGGWKIGDRLEMVTGPKAGTILEITSIDPKAEDGFKALEITYPDGSKEIAAEAVMDDAIDGKFEYELKWI